MKAHLSFSSGAPVEVTSMATRNSLKSMVPLWSVSKVRKTWSIKYSALPQGNDFLYRSTNWAALSEPSGHSCRKPRYSSRMVASSYLD